MAQVVERLVEPVSNTSWFGGHDDPKDDKPSQKAKVLMALDQASKNDAKKLGLMAAKDGTQKAELASLKQARAISLWCLASAIGIILCYLTVGLFQVVGILFVWSSIAGHLGDAVLSGLIVGGGTKPLHDLINLFDNKSDNKS
jgi:hypothetical protein